MRATGPAKDAPDAELGPMLLAAVRRDVRALGQPWILERLARWRAWLSEGDAEQAERARAWLSAIGVALLGGPTPTEETHAAGLLEVEASLVDDEASVEATHAAFDAARRGPVPEAFDEVPTNASADPLLADLVRARTPDADLQPTRQPPRPPPPPPADPEPPRPARPRASIVLVRALHHAIAPLCRELVPLEPERRLRRFWTLWREVSGDRGIRREAAEDILRRATDLRELAAELIAEVQGVDLGSVYTLLARLEADPDGPTRGPHATTAQPGRAAIVGASVRIEPVLAGELDE